MTKFHLMKKLLFLMCLVAAFATVAEAAVSVPEALYIVGDFQKKPWTHPYLGGTDLKMTDPDGDGIFVGEFDIPADIPELQFLINANSATEIKDAGIHYGFADFGIGYIDFPLYDDIDFTVNIDKIINNFNPEGSGELFYFSNWQGGTLKIKVDWNNMTVTFKGSNQPNHPDYPAEAWLIGDFNSWRVPKGNKDNGALALGEPILGPFGITFKGKVEVPAEANEFKIYTVSSDGVSRYWVNQDKFWLTNWHNPVTNVHEVGVKQLRIEPGELVEHGWDGPFSITNWKGGTMNVNPVFLWEDHWDSVVSVWSEDAPESPFSDKPIYLITETDGGNRKIQEINAPEYSMKVEKSVEGGECTVILSTENNLYPAQENCYGLSEDAHFIDVPDDEWGPYFWTEHFVLEEGGEPFLCRFPETGVMDIYFELVTGKVTVIRRLLDGGGVEETGVDDADNAPEEYFNLNGVRVNSITHGIYIVRKGSKTRKVLVG